MAYDKNNIFAKILRGEIPAPKVYEDDFVIAINDINPKALQHILVIPKGEYINIDDFNQNASADEIIGFFKAISNIAQELGLAKDGYRIVSNCGENGGQEVPHLHVHILGGEKLKSF